MLRVLVVDDSVEKLRAITRVILSTPGCQDARVDTAVDVHGAKVHLSSCQYDLLLLDLLLPYRVKDDPVSDGGIELLSAIDRDRRLFSPVHVLAISAEPLAVAHSREALDGRLWGIIAYDRTSNAWESRLRTKLVYLVATKRSQIVANEREVRLDLAIITALNEELQALKALPVDWVEVRHPGDPTLYFEGMFAGDDRSISVVIACASRMGMAATAVLATKIQARYSPHYICMTGLVAGVQKRTNIGDVLVADPSWDWGSGKFEVVDDNPRFAAEPIQVPLHAQIRARLKDAAADKSWLQFIRTRYPGDPPPHELRCHVESVASGAAVIADDRVLEAIGSATRKLYGVEMEIFGLMCAAQNSDSPQPIAFSAKSVCDFADRDKGDENRPYANWVSANFIYYFATRYLVRDLVAN